MRIKKIIFLILLIGAIFSLMATEEKKTPADTTQARFATTDKGPKTIDVSKYPKPMQEKYLIFSQKCSKCHTLARPINTEFVLPIEWERYIKRMRNKPGSGVGKEAKDIYEFLAYDSAIRKAELFKMKLAKLSEEERKTAEAKIKEILEKYNTK